MHTRVFQTSTVGGRIILTSRNRDLADHVGVAVRSARQGQRAWIKTRVLINGKLDERDDSRHYVIEYRLRDGQLEVTPFGGPHIIDPDHVSTPDWVRDACTITRNLINA